MRRARLILNPISWGHHEWSKLPEITDLLGEVGIRLDLAFTRKAEPVTDVVEMAVHEGYDLVIAGGGDGTVGEVATGLVGTGVPLGILPLGTFNNIAHSLGLPLDAHQAAANIARGKTRDVDVGDANGIRFFEAAGVGLDASIFPIGEEIKDGHFGKAFEGAATFLRHRKADFILTVDSNQVSLRSPMIVVANGPYYGAGFTIAPHADMADGLLDVITFDCNRVEMARQFALSARNRPHQEVCISMLRGREVTVSARLPLPAHADGKPIVGAPVTCRVIPGALRVIVP